MQYHDIFDCSVTVGLSDYEEQLVQKIPPDDIKTNSMHNIFNVHSQLVKNEKYATICLNSDNWLNKGVSEQ